MDDPAPPSLALASKDRRTGLIVFGVFEILLGAFCALLIPMMLIGQKIAAKYGHGPNPSVLPAIIIYAAIAITFLTLGIGSCRARRWARTLLLCLGWIGLCVGAFSIPLAWVALGSLDAQLAAQGRQMPAGGLMIVKIFAAATSFIIYVVIPGCLVLFYRRADVRATCERLDPIPRWTDRCPVPVLALCVFKTSCLIALLGALPFYANAFPLMGTILQGWLAHILWIAICAFMIYSILGFYRLNRTVWRISLVVIAILAVSYSLTYYRIGLMEYYRLAGLPEDQLAQLARSPLMSNSTFLLWIMGTSTVAYFGAVILVGRYFPKTTGRPAAA